MWSNSLRLGTLAAAFLALVAVPALAQVGRGGGGQYSQHKQLPKAEVEKRVAEILPTLAKGDMWTNRGVNHRTLLSKGNVVGHLWEDVDVKSLKAGTARSSRHGTRVELLSEEKSVGVLWLN